jgi:hypothetical protein
MMTDSQRDRAIKMRGISQMVKAKKIIGAIVTHMIDREIEGHRMGAGESILEHIIEGSSF